MTISSSLLRDINTGSSLVFHGDTDTLTLTVASVIYFSSISNNTHRFVNKLFEYSDQFSGRNQRFDWFRGAHRLPLKVHEETTLAIEPYVLITPTYGGDGDKNHVPRQVIKFLNVEQNRRLLRGVIAAGNNNFGRTYCIAGDIISQKCQVPLLNKFELMGTGEDISLTYDRLEEFSEQKI